MGIKTIPLSRLESNMLAALFRLTLTVFTPYSFADLWLHDR